MAEVCVYSNDTKSFHRLVVEVDAFSVTKSFRFSVSIDRENKFNVPTSMIIDWKRRKKKATGNWKTVTDRSIKSACCDHYHNWLTLLLGKRHELKLFWFELKSYHLKSCQFGPKNVFVISKRTVTLLLKISRERRVRSLQLLYCRYRKLSCANLVDRRS